ncbi:MAG: tetratricopeptide repeat protein [Treponema sp.]|jgi:tetratricopeptide (TPR) repeat protein|nr:tetratricopeptide repeat protein [Treponema sp.]
MAEKNDENSLDEKITIFVRNNRRKIFVCFGITVIVLAVFVGAVMIRDKLREGAISRVEEFTRRYEELRFNITDESNAENVVVLMEELSSFASGNSGYPGSRASALLAGIHGDKKEWAEAEQAWRDAADKAGKSSYLAPAALFNAAAAAEEQGKTAEAIALYTECLAMSDSFPSSPRAQFAVGRLEEKQGNKENALEAYRTLRTKWPNDTLWRNLAQSRIIGIEGEE